eukprot:1142123-Pelagomonas_calceolata.AAC.3
MDFQPSAATQAACAGAHQQPFELLVLTATTTPPKANREKISVKAYWRATPCHLLHTRLPLCRQHHIIHHIIIITNTEICVLPTFAATQRG